MAALEATQDPNFFQNMFGSFDEDHFKDNLDVSSVSKLSFRVFKKDTKSFIKSQFVNTSEQDDVAGQIVRTNPGFDPVFMKV